MRRTIFAYLLSLAALTLTLGRLHTCFAQSELLPSPAGKLNGTPKISVEERTYVVYRGQSVNEMTIRLSREEYDRSGMLTRESEFGGEIERRTTLRRENCIVKKEVHYFDARGMQNDTLGKDFTPGANISSELGLCPSFFEVAEVDTAGKVERYREICTDGSPRTTSVLEYGVSNELIRNFRQDSKSRTWETILEYDPSGALTELRFNVNDGERPKYGQTIRYSDYRVDEKRNWTRVTAVSYDSFHGDQIRYQFLEKRTIEYWPNVLRSEKSDV